MISSTSDYALRAVLVLAREYHQTLVPADEIARRTGAPRNYLAKTLNALAKAGVVTSARGPQGGFALSAPPDDITIAAVVDCFSEARTTTHCLLGNGPCNATAPCTAHNRWKQVENARRAPLLETTLGQLLAVGSK